MNDILRALTKSISKELESKAGSNYFWFLYRIKKVRSRQLFRPYDGFKIEAWSIKIAIDGVSLYMSADVSSTPLHTWTYDLADPSFDPTKFSKMIIDDILEFATFES